MKRSARLACTVLVALALLSAPSFATITFTQLDADVFVVSHRVKVIGSRGKAMKMVYTKAASLCVAAGYSHYRILEQESEAAQQDDAANASVRVRLFLEEGEDRLACQPTADPAYVQEASQKLARRGYAPPGSSAPAPASGQGPEAAEATGTCPGGCTVEQIAAMARAGLSDEQIVAACSDPS